MRDSPRGCASVPVTVQALLLQLDGPPSRPWPTLLIFLTPHGRVTLRPSSPRILKTTVPRKPPLSQTPPSPDGLPPKNRENPLDVLASNAVHLCHCDGRLTGCCPSWSSQHSSESSCWLSCKADEDKCLCGGQMDSSPRVSSGVLCQEERGGVRRRRWAEGPAQGLPEGAAPPSSSLSACWGTRHRGAAVGRLERLRSVQ